MSDLLVVRGLFLLLLGAVGFASQPFGLPAPLGATAGLAAAGLIILLEFRLRTIHLKHILGAAGGAVIGAFLAFLITLVIRQAWSAQGSATSTFVQLAILLILTYVGIAVGATKGEMLDLSALGGLVHGSEKSAVAQPRLNLLDTSVIIDGRIADIAETGFLDGALVIPQFVLRELQLVADSADSIKRNRGRRGLDVLQRLQKMTNLSVQIMEVDFPAIRDVDMKLVELGKLHSCKIVTNDFNLNKVAQLHGVQVLNINELANALKPIVLPGEQMKVFVLKEGKEYNQGVAYLDDGTMVVVDNARRMISKTIDISVTSVLQTTAGKMIFGRFDERSHSVHGDQRVTTERQAQKDRAETSAAAGPQ